MKKKFLFLILNLCFVSAAFADLNGGAPKIRKDEKIKNDSFGYVSPGFSAILYAPIPVPNIGLGYRYHEKKIGMDICVSAYPYFFLNAITADGSLLFYSKKNVYGGFGVSGCFMIMDAGLFNGHEEILSFYLVAGKEYYNKERKKRFLQLMVGSPSDAFVPYIGFKYGIAF